MAELDWKKFIRESDLLGSLSRAEITQLLKPDASEERKFAAGEAIITQEERGRSFYIIGSGSVAISRPAPEGGEINLAVLEPGEFFGEMALLSQQPRSANVRARDDCTVLRINADSLRTLLDKHPEILAGIFMMLSERLRDLAARVIDVSFHDVNNKLELFSTKLDAELKAVNSTLAATQVVFDQTAQRANDVITSTERYWKRLTMTVGLISTTLVTGLSWYGISSYRDFKEAKDGIIREAADLKIHISALRSGATYSVLPMLDGLGERSAKGAQYYLPLLQNNLQVLLSTDDENSTTIMFKELYNWMLETLLKTKDKEDELRRFHSQADIIFTGMVDSKLEMPLRNKALSYYFLMANQVFEQNFGEYDIRLNELDKLLRGHKESWIILDADKTLFDPLGFELALDGLEIPPDKRDDISRRIEAVWKKIAKL